MAGGQRGMAGHNYVLRSNGSLINLKGCDACEMQAGDIFVIETPGGGGFGVVGVAGGTGAGEGRADVLIEDGKVRTQRLRKELITMPQLQAAAHKQGFASLSEVEQCVLEPGGTMTFIGKKPGAEDVRHQELLGKMESLAHEIALLRGSQPPARA
jgi:hypothetical protein